MRDWPCVVCLIVFLRCPKKRKEKLFLAMAHLFRELRAQNQTEPNAPNRT